MLSQCNDHIYVFLFWELRGLSPNFHIHVSVSDLYIPRIGPHISSSRKGRPIVGIYNSLTDTWMWKLGLRPRYSFSGNICFKFLAFCLYSVRYIRMYKFLKCLWKAKNIIRKLDCQVSKSPIKILSIFVNTLENFIIPNLTFIFVTLY